MPKRQSRAVGLYDPGGSNVLIVGVQHADMDRIPIEGVALQLVRVILGREKLFLDAVSLVSQTMTFLEQMRRVVDGYRFESRAHGGRLRHRVPLNFRLAIRTVVRAWGSRPGEMCEVRASSDARSSR